jgi:RHS repeat-associated protein
MGKTGGSDGDTLEDPTTSFEYQVFRWKDEQKPNYVHVLERELHGEANERFQEQYVYSDGAGNVVMTKKKVEPGDAPERDSNGALVYDTEGNLVVSPADPRWVGSGRTVLDNKGNPVKKYEPFFSATHEYEDDEDLVQWGVTPVLRYDPLGRLVRTEFPDGTIARLTFDPWRVESWDQNDTVLDPDCEWFAIRDEDAEPPPDPFPSDEDARAANLSEAHAGTPAVAHLDPLGRVVLAVQDNGSAGTYETRVAYDVEGNALEVTDARGNAATQTTYGPGGTALHHVSNDAGERFSLPDVLGAAHRSWDQRGHEVRVLKDALRRPTHEFVAEGSLGTGIEILRLRTFYGEGVTDAVDFNLRGRVYAVFHGAGLSVHENFDFKGNLSEKRTRIVADDTAEPEWDAIDTSTPDDAEGDASSLLESESFTETTTYDALNRAVSANTPDDSERKPTYNDAGLLEMVEARLRDASTWTSFVTAIDYDAHGRRVRVDYDSGVVTEYTYDPLSFRLVRALTTRPAPNAATLLDLRFWYDAVGNVVEIHNDAEDTVYFDNQQVTPNQLFEYDALYRLVSATGREHATTLNDSERDHQELPYGNMPQNGTALRTYTETYTYDEVGNFLSFHHDGGTGATWTRNYGIETTTNRLLGSGPETEAPWSSEYDHDEHGNMTSMPHLAAKIWNTRDQLREVDLGGGGTAYYLYDAAGQRVRKRIVHNGSTVDERLYLGAWERYRRTVNSTLDTERETLHVADDARRIALVETLTVDEGSTVSSPTPRTRMQHDNHLGTALLELTDDGSVISYEEYHPYGTTAYHAADSSIEVSAKRYRYTGKERDDETGLYYHGARYYACWLGRWTATDPLGAHEGVGLYTYCGGSPVILHDPTGQAYVVPLDGPPAPPAPPATPPPAAKEKAAKPAAPGAKGPPPEADPEAPSSAKPATTAGKPGKAAAPKKSAKSPAGPPKAETALPAPFGPEYVFEGAPARLPPGETWIKRGGGIPAVGPARLPLPPGAPYAWRMLNPNLQLAVTPEGVRIWSELRTLKDLSVVREEVRYDPKEGAYRTSLVTVVPAPPSADDLEFGPARLTSPEGAAERVDVHDDGTIVLRRESGAVTRFFPDPDDPDHYTYFEDGTWYDIILSEEFFAPLRALE